MYFFEISENISEKSRNSSKISNISNLTNLCMNIGYS